MTRDEVVVETVQYCDQVFSHASQGKKKDHVKNRHNSKENFSAISATKNFQICEHLVEIVQYRVKKKRRKKNHVKLGYLP